MDASSTSEKKSIETLVEYIKSVIIENLEFDKQDQSISIAPSGTFVPSDLRCNDQNENLFNRIPLHGRIL